jgi:hypothetical protein
MIRTRKRLISKIATLDKQLTRDERELRAHKKHLFDFMMRNRALLIATVVPLFLWGLRHRRVRSLVKVTSTKLVRSGLMAAFFHTKKLFLPSFLI